MPETSQRRLFLTPPTHFEIKYVINAWMDAKNQADSEKARQQWDALVAAYRRLGPQVEVIDLPSSFPDSVFVGDSIFLYQQHAFAANFRHPERAAEVAAVVAHFRAKGYEVHEMPEGVFFEGNGDTMAWNDVILGGYGQRSDRRAHDVLADVLGVQIVPIAVQPPHFHADTTICPLDERTLAYVPSAMDEDSQKRVRALGADLIEISPEEAMKLACNSFAVGKTVILSTDQAPKLSADLEKAGFEPLPMAMSEFAKSGGGAKCLTLEAYKAE